MRFGRFSTAALVSLAASIGLVVSAELPAAATTVTTEAELRAAFANATETNIELANDIDLTDCNGGGALTRNSATSLTLDGQGFSIEQTCPDRVVAQEGSGPLTLLALTITGGTTASSDGGGGVLSNGPVTVQSSTMRENSATAGGGGAISAEVVMVTNTTLAGNQGGTGGGGAISANQTTVTASTIAGNSAEVGGGIAAAEATITNSTVTGNTGTQLGGGVLIGQGELDLVYSDVVGNTSPVGANINFFAGGGSTLRAFGSVITGPLGGGTNCVAPASTPSQGYNFSDDSSCKLTASTDRELAGSPGLGALNSNGGPTQTLLPQPGSPLVNFIPVADCQLDGASGITTDQRALPRPATSDGCDIGAVELQPPGAPTNVVGVAMASASASVRFVTPMDTGLSPITGYTVTCTTLFETRSNPGAQSPIVVTGLTNGAIAQCVVQAINAAGAGPASAPPAQLRVGVPYGPTMVTAAPGAVRGSIALAWNTAQGNGSPPSSYSATCMGPTVKSVGAGSSMRSTTITGLLTGKNYHCFVSATNARGTGPNFAATPLVLKPKA